MQVSCLSSPPAPLLLGWLYVIHPGIYVYSGLGRREQLTMKTFQKPKTHGIMNRWQMTGEKWGEEIFGAMELPNCYADHSVGRHLFRELVRQTLTRSSCFFSS